MCKKFQIRGDSGLKKLTIRWLNLEHPAKLILYPAYTNIIKHFFDLWGYSPGIDIKFHGEIFIPKLFDN